MGVIWVNQNFYLNQITPIITREERFSLSYENPALNADRIID